MASGFFPRARDSRDAHVNYPIQVIVGRNIHGRKLVTGCEELPGEGRGGESTGLGDYRDGE